MNAWFWSAIFHTQYVIEPHIFIVVDYSDEYSPDDVGNKLIAEILT